MVIGWNIEKKRKKIRKKSLLETLALTDVAIQFNVSDLTGMTGGRPEDIQPLIIGSLELKLLLIIKL